MAIQALEHETLPPSAGLTDPDPALALDVLRQARGTRTRRAMSNSFGFGGSNCSLVFERQA